MAEGQWATTPSTTANLGGTHVVVIKGLLPDAESLMKDERDTWEYTDPHFHNIRDIPLQMDDGNNGSGRQSYLIPDGGALAQALDERTAPIRARLGVNMVQRVGIASKPSGLSKASYAQGLFSNSIREMGEEGKNHQQVYQAKAKKALPMDPPLVLAACG